MTTEYYIAVNGAPVGPMSLEELLKRDLKPESLIWKPGMEQWVKASEMPELASIFEISPEPVTPEEKIWYAMIEGRRQVGPLTISELLAEGLREDTPVWTAGMADWTPARNLPEFETALKTWQTENFNGNNPGVPPNPYYGHQNAGNQWQPRNGFSERNSNSYGHEAGNPNFSRNPQYDDSYYYSSQRQYDHRYEHRNDYQKRPQLQTNWLPWAIGATVAGFFCSCIGAIFGIIGIVQANKANTLYSQGYDEAADRANGNAKIMTIIGYIFAGIGIIATIFLKGFYSSWLNI